MNMTKGLTLIILLAVATSLQARDLDFNYVQGTVGIFDLDVDESFDDGTDNLSIETDDDISYDAEGAWQPFQGASAWYDNVHFFAAIGATENDLEVSGTVFDTPVSVDGSVDIFRLRGGVGYGYPVNEQVNLYGRVTWDYVELQDISLGGASTDDVDDNGVRFDF